MRNFFKNKTTRTNIKRMLAVILVFIITLTSVNFNSFMKAKAAEYKTLYFIDNTAEQWVKNDSAVMELVDNTNGHDSYWMTQMNDATWCVNVPESAYNITFNRYSSDKTTKWNSWSAGGRDENNAYYADGAEYGHWDVVEEGENYFQAGDIIYLDLSEFPEWENDDALMYVNFTDASKEENGGNDVSIANADKNLYTPQEVADKIDEYVYQYTFTEDSEGAVNVRFWRGNADTLWNYSPALSYAEYLDGMNCIKVKDWDNAGDILSHNIESDIDKDSDNDGLPDLYEDRIGTNKDKKDSDNDGLDDYTELSLGYSPVLSDTNEDGVSDGEEDFEGDGLRNKEEVNIGTDISWWDTDDDGLNDYDEINNHYTLPLMEDTDNDGIVDGIEVKFGLDPLKKDSNGDGIEDSFEKITYLFDAKLMIDDYDKNVYPQIELFGDAETLDSFEISVKENNCVINQRIPGYIGNAYEFTTESEFESAKVTFYIEPSLFEDENFLPAIYYFNEEKQFLEMVDDQMIDGNTVSANLEHFSTYIVLNKKKFDEVWETEIAYFDDDEIEKPFDIAFVIDASGSMSRDPKPKNDKDGLRLTLSQAMVKKLAPEDRAMVIKFNLNATLLQTLTNDKELMISAISEVDSYGATAMFDGIHLANSTYALESDDNHRKIMIVITDGIDNYSIYSANTVINEAKANDVKIYTIGLGSQIDEAVLKRIASETGGKYYYASVASDLENVYDEIEDETIDYETDSNNDGISDYYTKMLCEGKLGTGMGITVFEGIPYEEIQKNDDYDGDGLKNGDELEVKKYMTYVHVKMNSDPETINSDNDVYSDYDETKVYYTDPLEENLIIERDVVEFLVDGDSYYASLYEEEYLKSDTKQVCAWIGNNLYDSISEEDIYKEAMVEYFTTINSDFSLELEERERTEFILQCVGAVGSVVDEARISLKHDADALDALLELERQIEHIKENIIDLENSSNGFTKADFYEQYDIMQGYLEEASQKSEDIKASLNRNVTVKGKILTFAQGKSATVITKTLAWAPNVLQVGIAGVEEYDKYITLKANMETLKANIYILEILSESAYKESVKNAASSLLSIARAEYVAIEKEVLDILAACGKELKNVLLQVGISKIPVVGFWIDMGMTISNIIIPVSDVTKYAVRVCGDSCMATILAADLKGYLCRDIHQTLTGEKIYVVDSDSINEVVKKYNNLIEMRKFGENDMIVLHENQAEFVKWMLEKFGHNSQEIINDCKATINLLEWLKGYYLDVSF